MTFLLGILIRLAVGVAFRRRRAVETRRASSASDYLLAVANRKVEYLAREVARRDIAIAKIKAMAIRLQTERILNLGGSVSLPDPARRTRQLSTDRIVSEQRMAGPSGDGPRFLGR